MPWHQAVGLSKSGAEKRPGTCHKGSRRGGQECLRDFRSSCAVGEFAKGDHHGKSNGEAEAAVEITQGLCRTFKDACETGMGVQIDPRSPMLAWLIEHAGNMYTLYAHDESMKDGLTPYRRLKGT